MNNLTRYLRIFLENINHYIDRAHGKEKEEAKK